MKTLSAIVILLCSALSTFAADTDLILHNGKILTVDPSFSVREAVAIQGDRI